MGIYHRPCNLEDALSVLAGGGVTIAAGCTDLFAATDAPELAGPVLDITALDGVRGVLATAEGWRIGAATPWAEIARAPLPGGFDMLRAAAREVGSVQIQNAATVAGNLCNASPAADGVPALLALEAEVELASVRGRRRVRLEDFLTGVRQTALAGDEMVLAVHVPRHGADGQSRFLKLGARRYMVISIAMVAVRVVLTQDRIDRAAIAVGACSPVARRLPAVEAALAGLPLARAAGAVDAAAIGAALDPITDMRAGAGYRSAAAGELVRRALREIAGGAS